MENLKFVLFHPVSICIKGKYFKYGINEGTFYPCLLGIIKEDNICIEVISGRKFDIVSKEDNFFTEITNSSKVVGNPVYIYKNIYNSIENLKFIEEYINKKGNVNQNKIDKYDDFSNRLNKLRSIQEEREYNKSTWNSLLSYKFVKYYLEKIDIENSKSLKEFSYIQSGQKNKDELAEKDKIISRLKKQLSKQLN